MLDKQSWTVNLLTIIGQQIVFYIIPKLYPVFIVGTINGQREIQVFFIKIIQFKNKPTKKFVFYLQTQKTFNMNSPS